MAWVLESEDLRNKASNVPLTSATNMPEDQQSSQDAQDESWTHMIGRTLKESALPVAGGLAGAALGTMIMPGAGTVGGEMLGSAGGEWLSQKLGLTKPGESITGMDPGTEQILMAGALPGIGRAVGTGARAAIKATTGGRILAKDIAQEAIGKLETPLAQDIRNFFSQAVSGGKVVDLPITAQLGDKTVTTTAQHTFQEGVQAVRNLEQTIAGMESRGEGTAAAKYHLSKLNDMMEKEFPGWKSTKANIQKLATTGQVDAIREAQGFVNETGPLAAFEQALSQGQVFGSNGMVQAGGSNLRALAPETINSIRGILADLGPQPGHNAVRTLIEGRALGHVAGALFGGAIGAGGGFERGGLPMGMLGGATGMLAGMFIPAAFDSMIAKGMTHPVLRQMIKDAVAAKAIGKPEFWASLAQVGTRLLGNTFVPQPPPPTPPMPPQPQMPPADQGAQQ